MIDRYTKVVLTVIALSLATLAIEQAGPPAHAAPPSGCGSFNSPCYVANSFNAPLFVGQGG